MQQNVTISTSAVSAGYWTGSRTLKLKEAR